MIAVNTNIESLMSSNYSRLNSIEFGEKVERLSNGFRVNRGADDPSGLAISSGMMAHMRGTSTAISNALDDLNLLRTADSALGDIQDVLFEMRDLSVRMANGAAEYAKTQGNPAAPKPALLSEAQQLYREIELLKDHLFQSFRVDVGGNPMRIIPSLVNYNQKILFDTTGGLTGEGFAGDGQSAQIGPDNQTSHQIQIIFSDIQRVLEDFATPYTPDSLPPADVTPLSWYVEYAKFRIDDLDGKLSTISDVRAEIGTWDMRIQHTIDDLNADYISTAGANSRIMDANMADEITALTKNQIRKQTEGMMAAQVAATPLITLSLLNGIYNGLLTNQS